MRKLKHYIGSIGAMREIQIEASPDMTPDDVREIDKQLCLHTIKKANLYKHICEQKAAVDYDGSYRKWLKGQLEEHGEVMWMADNISVYLAANEYRKICLAELARIEQKKPQQGEKKTAAGKPTNSGNKTPQEGMERHFDSELDNKTLTDIFKALTNKHYLAADSDLNAWLWICTGKGNKPATVPLKWEKPATDIAVMVQLVFGGKRGDERWETAAACFLVQGKDKEWKAPDTQYLAKRVSGKKGNLGQLRVTQIGKIIVPNLTK